MPLTGDPSKDIPELIHHGKRKRSRRQIIAIAMAEQRRRGKKKAWVPWTQKDWQEPGYRRPGNRKRKRRKRLIVSIMYPQLRASQGKGWMPWKEKALGTVSDAAGGSVVSFPGSPKKKRTRRKRCVTKAFEESKHPRSHGKFSRSAASGSRHNPDLDAAMDMEPNRPQLGRIGGDPFAEHQTGTQNLREFPKRAQPPAEPHQRTQQAALNAARAVKPGDQKSHAAAVQALDAHLEAGLAELKRRAAHAGARGGNMYRRAAREFRAKMSLARARIDQIAGRGPPPVPRRPGQPQAHHHRQRREPPPLSERGKVKPFVSMGLPPLTAWIPWHVKSSAIPFHALHKPGDPALLDLPDIRQQDDYSCWAAQTMGVARFFGVGPNSLEKWKKMLGTNPKTSTSYDRVVHVLRKFGLSAEPRHFMTVEDLEDATSAGYPVLCAVQDYGPALNKKSEFDYGHCLTVIGCHFGYVFVQDSSEENALEGEGSLSSDGRDMIAEDVWMQNWYDQDPDGKKYTRFGIIVGPPERARR